MTTMMVEEENKMDKSNAGEESIKYYCRVCISNTKTKKAKSAEESIGIFKRAGLKSILEKYLHLQISEDDRLPKVICKVCFDKLMAIEFLQIVARRTESLFKDYIIKKTAQELTTAQERHHDGGYSNSYPTPYANPKVEDVVVNVSMSDPLTKNIKKKLQVAQNTRDSIGTAFSPDYLSRNAVTSSPITQVPLTIVHRMPKKRKIATKPLESKHQAIQSPPPQTNAMTTTVTLENPPKAKFPPFRPKMKATPPLRHISEAPTIPQNVEIHPVVSGNPPAMGNGMPLGSIIKDEDLLKLILKALKWPYNSQTLDIQIQRLKDTNFNDIIVDPNLLQDTDLIQILGPLLGPLPVTMQQPTYHITIPPDSMASPPTTMSYKLPAETSVQIITVPAVDKETSSSSTPTQRHRPTKRHIKASLTRKKLGNTLIAPKKLNEYVIVVSDESEEDLIMPTKVSANNDDIPNFGVQLDPAVYPNVEDNSNSNETMLATLNRQREAMMRMHRSKRKQSLKSNKNVEMVDDIMIVDEGFHVNEPYPDVVLVKKNRRSHEVPPSAASTSQSKTVLNTALAAKQFEKMNQALPPVITKPEPTTIASASPTTLNQGGGTLDSSSSNSNSKPAKPSAPRGFVKLKGSTSNLPPLKKVKLLTKASPSYVPPTPKEPSKPVNVSKNTTVAHADSTTKIMVKETKVPQPSKPPSADIEDQISKVKIGKQVQSCSTSSGGNSSGGRKGNKEEAFIIVECEEKCNEKVETKPVPKAKTNKIKKEVESVSRPEAKKSELRVLGTFEVSDDDMEPLVVEEVSEEPSVDEPGTVVSAVSAASEEERSLLKKVKTSVQEESPSVESKIVEEEEKQSTNIELPPIDIEVKAEDKDDVQIKREEIGSMNASRTGKSDVDNESPKRNFVASKTAVKSEAQKPTRSTTKRKVQPKEEPILEITTFRPARKSKTLSKYYKGPPLSETAETTARSMRSRT